jgi:tetratricopeptide (TPR) repeat protein
VLGEKNPMLVSFRADRASYLDRAGRHAEAMAELDAAVEGAARVFGEGSREHIDNLVLRGGRHYLADRYDRAHADLSKGVVMADKLWGPSGEATLIYRNLLGTNLTAAGRLDEARLELAANVAAAEKALSADAPLYVDALARLAKAERLAGETARATRRLERALSRLGAQPNPPLEAFVRWQLGQSLGSGARAVELIEIARRFYASPAGDPQTTAEIDAWVGRQRPTASGQRPTANGQRPTAN